MKELNDIVVEKTAEMINDGTVEKMISDNLEKTIGACVADALKSHSDFGRAISEKIEESIQCAGRDIEIPEYNLFIAQVVKDKFTQVLKEQAAQHVADLVGEVIYRMQSKI